ncbi:MAG: hypothetical protein CEE43_04995 [Promethearchaeota archaeon Loki_b32]|nr:MAG: hypothetical protein CEE43_04995 [Candidatus Lokiarchaeota archaeon Loki_b32]
MKTPIFTLENHKQGSNAVSKTLMSRFIDSLQSIASQIENDEGRVIKIGNKNYFIIKDTIINFKYIIEYSNENTFDQISLILNKVKNKFIERFEGKLDLPISMKIDLVALLKEDILEFI